MFFITIFSLYAIFICLLMIGWNRSASLCPGDNPTFDPLISVIVAARNESLQISELLNDLSVQRNANFEVIIVDDQSEDDTALVVKAFVATDHRFKLVSSAGQGKKMAITQGVGVANGSIVVTTDADCRVGADWLHNMCRPFADPRIMMVFGGVRMEGHSFFDKLQAQEFVSLIGSAAAAAGLKRPVLCNGANLAFRRATFDQVKGYHGNFEVASGDDEFLMRKIIAQYPDAVSFAHDSQTVVTTATNSNARQFLHQRLRWAGKWAKHTDTVSKAIALFVLVFQLSTLILMVLTLFNRINTSVAISLLLFKMMLEVVFLAGVNRFLKVRFNVWAFLVLQLLYPVYVSTIGVLCNFMDFEWKGRGHSNSLNIKASETADYSRR